MIDTARRLTIQNGRDFHGYKASPAAPEDLDHASREWCNRHLATSDIKVRGWGDRDNRLVERTRGASDA